MSYENASRLEKDTDERAYQTRLWTEKNWSIIARFSGKPCEPSCDIGRMQKITREDGTHYRVCRVCESLYETSKI